MARKKETEEEATIREMVDSAKEMIQAGMADAHLVDIYNVVVNRAGMVENRNGGNATSQREQKKSATTSPKSPSKTSGAKSTTRGSSAKSASKKEQLYQVPRVKKFAGVEVRIVSTSKKDPAKSNVEVVTGNEGYPDGKKLQISTQRLTKV